MPFEYTPKQREALKLFKTNAEHICLMGGSRSGKTLLACCIIAARALRAERTTHLIARLRFTDVKTKIAMKTWEDALRLRFPDLASGMNRTDWFFKFPNGSVVWFGGLDDKARVEKILGSEFSTIYLNECSQIPYDGIPTIQSRLAEKSILIPKMIYDLNPVGRSYWTYRMFHEKVEPKSRKALPYPELYEVIQMNPADNLQNISENYMRTLEAMPERDQQRFLHGNYISDVEGALWSVDQLEKCRIEPSDMPDMRRKLVSIDPAVTANKNSDETGIMVGGLGVDGFGYLEADYSCRVSPQEWAQRAVNAYHKHECDAIVAEVNNGGDMVKTIIRGIDATIKVIDVRASRGKIARAEPVSAAYGRGEIKHVGKFVDLEDQMTTYAPETMMKSPDRLDALVWLMTELMLKKKRELRVRGL